MNFSGFLLKVFGWKLEGKVPDVKKMVAVSAPHTSMWDFVLARLFLYQINIKPHFLVKKELFFFPLGFLMKFMGGVPVDRSKKTDIIDRIIDQFNHSEYFLLAITPEGTRKNVIKWKTGFHSIAKGANVPILPTFFDYKRKVIGIGELFYPSENVETDIQRIKEFVKDVVPKHPKLYIRTKK